MILLLVLRVGVTQLHWSRAAPAEQAVLAPDLQALVGGGGVEDDLQFVGVEGCLRVHVLNSLDYGWGGVLLEELLLLSQQRTAGVITSQFAAVRPPMFWL